MEASLLIHGLPSPITLVDTTGRRKTLGFTTYLFKKMFFAKYSIQRAACPILPE